MNTFKLHIFAAERPFYEGECESLVVPVSDGTRGFQAHHRNVITAVFPGILQFRVPGEATQIVAVSRGMLKVENNEMLILVESAERPEEIEPNRAAREADAAKEALLQKKSLQDYKSAEARLARALTRLRIQSQKPFI